MSAADTAMLLAPEPIIPISRHMGLGGTDMSAILGLNPWRSPWDVYAEKTGLLDGVIPAVEDQRKTWGKRLQRLIATEAYPEVTGRKTLWVDRIMSSSQPGRPWQVWTPDAICECDEKRGLDAKTCGIDQAPKWGEAGTDEVPAYVAVQAHWYLSASGFDAWDIALLIAGNDLRIYTIERDQEIEDVLLNEAERFWRNHVLADIPPEIQATSIAADYLRHRFPRNNGNLRPPTGEEAVLIEKYRPVRAEFAQLQKAKADLEMQIKLAIGPGDGLEFGRERITYKKAKDGRETNWEAIARPLLAKLPAEERETLLDLQTRVKPGTRRIYVKLEGAQDECVSE